MPIPQNISRSSATQSVETWKTGASIRTQTINSTGVVYAATHTYAGARTPHYRASMAIKPLNAYVRRDSVTDTPLVNLTLRTQSQTNADYYQSVGTYGFAWLLERGGNRGLVELEAATAAAMDRPDWKDLSNRAIDKCNANVDIGPFIAQIGLARKMLVEMVKRIGKFFTLLARKIKSGKLGTSPIVLLNAAVEAFNLKGPKGVSALYLEIIYGWRPLITDMVNIYNHLVRVAKGTQTLPKLLHGRASRTPVSEAIDCSWTRVYYAENGTTCNLVFHATGTLSTGYNAHAIGVPRFEKQVLALNPLKTMWDVVGFSFVLDWVYNLSSFLGALEIGLYTDIIGLSRGSYYRRLVTITATGVMTGSPTKPSAWKVGAFSASAHGTFDDEVRARSPSSDFSAKLPELDLIPAFKHFWEILALVLVRGKRVYE